MTRKPLPKAIRRPIAKLQEAGPNIGTGEAIPATSSSFDKVEAEPALAVSSAPIANDVAPAVSEQAKALAAQRLSLARKVVERHRTYAAMGGLLPVPVANIAGVTAINMRMVKQLSDLYHVPFQRDRARAMIIGLMGGAVPTGLGAATASTLAFVLPAAAFVGLGVSAVTAATVTRAIGRVFVESFESGAVAGYRP